MTTIDSRVVELKFIGSEFESGVRKALGALDNLNKGLKMDGATKGLNDVGSAVKNNTASLDGISGAVDKISSKFGAMGAIGFTVFQSLTNSAIGLGKKLLSSLVGPLVEGGKARALTIEQAKFQFKGLGMDVDKTMASAKAAVLGTAYGLGDAAKAASMFGASGMRAGKEMTSSLRAIAGVAAMTGSSYSDISDVFTAVAGNGRMMGSDLLRLSSRGVNAAATIAKSLGKTEAEVRDMTTKGKISFKIFSEAMDGAFGAHAADANQTYAGSLANMKAALSRIGAAIATPAFEAQRKVFNAMTPVIDNIAKALKPAIDAFGKFSSLRADGLVKILKGLNFDGLKKSIPRVLDAIKNISNAVMQFVKPIKNAFREIFPSASINQLYDFIEAFDHFTTKLKMGETTSNNVKRAVAGFFALIDIGKQILNGVINMFLRLFGSMGNVGGGFANIAGNVGDFLVKLDIAMKKGTALNTFFETLGNILLAPIAMLKVLGKWLANIFSGESVDTNGLGSALDALGAKFNFFNRIGDYFKAVWEKIGGVVKSVAKIFGPLGGKIGDLLANLGTAIVDAFKKIDYNAALDTINTGLMGGMLLLLKNFLARGLGSQLSGGFLASIKSSLWGLTTHLKVMQSVLKAKVLMLIAGAIALLTVSIVALSMIDSKKLTMALVAMGVMFKELTVGMAALDAISARGSGIKLTILGISIMFIAIAINILASAVTKLSKLSWEELSKGMAGVMVLLAGVTGAARLMPDAKKMISAGAGLILMAVAIKLLVSSVKDLSGMGWEEMAKGLVGVSVLLGALALFTRIADTGKGAVAQGAGLILLAVALKILASATSDFAAMDMTQLEKGIGAIIVLLAAIAIFSKVADAKLAISALGLVTIGLAMKILAEVLADFGGMSWEEIAKGMVVLAGSLGIIAAAMYLMSGAIPGAAALIIVAAALSILAPVFVTFGGMDWEAIKKAAVVLAGALLIISGAMFLMSGALAGAAALIIVAGALAILAPILVTLGGMSWEAIGKGLAALAGAFIIIGVAGLLLTPVIPTLIGLGVAIGLIGIGVMLAGAGLLAMSAALVLFSGASALATSALVGMVTAILGLIPMALAQLGLGIVAFAEVITQGAPAIVGAIVAILLSLIAAIVTIAPQIITALMKLLFMIVDALVKAIPRLVVAGLNLLLGILRGISDNIGKIVTVVATIITNFLNALTARLPGIIQAGTNLIVAFIRGIGNSALKITTAAIETIITFVNGLATAIRTHTNEMNAAGSNLAKAIVEGMVKGISGGISSVVTAAKNMAKGALDAAKNFLGIHSPSKEFEKLGVFVNQGFAKGLTGSKSEVQTAYDNMKNLLSSAMKSATKDVTDSQAKLVKLTYARKMDNEEIKRATVALAKAQGEVGKKGHASAADEVENLKVKIQKLTHARALDDAAIKNTSAAIVQSQKERAAASAAYSELTKNLTDEKNKLQQLSISYDELAVKIKDATKVLEDAKKTRDDYNASVAGQYDNLPTLNKDTKLTDYITGLQDKIADTASFSEAIQKLRDLGLSDEMYKELLSKGIDALPFIQELLAGGKESVNTINDLSSKLSVSAKALGATASAALYQAGVDAAQGLVTGLQSQQAAVEAQAAALAAVIERVIRLKLKIKSPSKVMQEMGKNVAQGLANGLDQYSSVVAKSSEGVGHQVIDSLRKSITDLSEIVSGDMDLNPVITPVLDLTSVKKDASTIGSLLAANQISVDSAYAKATDASLGYSASRISTPTEVIPVATPVAPITFKQYNNSPKALSNAEIYRQTKNQLSVVKGALAT